MIAEFYKRISTALRSPGLAGTVARGATGSFGVTIAGVGLNFAAHVVLARVMTEADYGEFLFVLTWVMILTLVANLGMDTAVQRFLSVYRGNSDWAGFHGLLRLSNLVGILSSLTIGLGLVVFTWALQARIGDSLTYTFWFGAAALFLSTLCLLRQMTMRALQHVVKGQIPDQMVRPVVLGLGVLVLFNLGDGPVTSPAAMTIYAVATACAFIIGSFWLHGILKQKIPKSAPDYRSREWFDTAFFLLLITALNQILQRTDIIMLGFINGTDTVASYAVAARLANFVLIGVTASNSISGPLIARHYAQENQAELHRTVRLGVMSIAAISLPIAFTLLVFGKYLLAVFGTNYIAAYIPLAILTAGQLLKAMFGPTGPLLNFTGHQRRSFLFTGTAAILNVILNGIMIPLMGETGAALATSSSLIFLAAIMAARVSISIKVNPTIFLLFRRKAE